MNSPYTEELTSPLRVNFYSHPNFDREAKDFTGKHRTFPEALKSLRSILGKQFDPVEPILCITPNHLHNITSLAEYALWKVTCVVPDSGLRRSQMPRVYFALRASSIYFLHMCTHVENYDDAEAVRVAKDRATDLMA